MKRQYLKLCVSGAAALVTMSVVGSAPAMAFGCDRGPHHGGLRDRNGCWHSVYSCDRGFHHGGFYDQRGCWWSSSIHPSHY